MSKKLLIDAIGFLLIALVVVIGYKLSPILLPKADVSVFPDASCDLQREACSVALPGGGRVELSMATRPIPMVKPFQVEVKVTGAEAKQVEVDFTGIDMNMGPNRPVLRKRPDGVYAAEVTLPVCITGLMDWQVTVLLEIGSQQFAIPYRFSSGRHD